MLEVCGLLAVAVQQRNIMVVTGRPWEQQRCSTGLRLLGQSLGSTSFVHSFFADHLQANMEDSAKLVDSVSEPHTAIRLFAQCTLHKLPHIMGYEVMYYCFSKTNYKGWND